MMTLSSRAVATAFASVLLMSTAFAQTTAPAPAPAAPAAAPAATSEPAAKKPRTAASMECSKEADAKGLHGKKERKPFMKQCKADAKAKMAAPK
jgi:hypothetical protein